VGRRVIQVRSVRYVVIFFRRASYHILTGALLTCLAVLTIQPLVEYQELLDLQQAYISLEDKRESALPLTSDDRDTLYDWRQSLADMRPDYDSIEDERQVKTDSYSGIFKYNADRVFEEQTTIFYQEDVWDMSL